MGQEALSSDYGSGTSDSHSGGRSCDKPDRPHTGADGSPHDIASLAHSADGAAAGDLDGADYLEVDDDLALQSEADLWAAEHNDLDSYSELDDVTLEDVEQVAEDLGLERDVRSYVRRIYHDLSQEPIDPF